MLSCFEEGTYIQKKDLWKLKLDVATVVKTLEKAEDEVHPVKCIGCTARPIHGPCYKHRDFPWIACQSCYDTNLSQEEQAKFSRCDPANVGPQLLTEGSVEGEEDHVKADRDACFPLEIMERAYSEGTQIKITEAEASVKQDFARIINSINGVPSAQLDTHKPDLSHQNCKEVTQRPLYRMPLIAVCRWINRCVACLLQRR